MSIVHGGARRRALQVAAAGAALAAAGAVLAAAVASGALVGAATPTARPAGRPAVCDDDPVQADVTGDGRLDRVVHAWTGEAAVLAVCTAAGEHDAVEGVGQSELLVAADVLGGGRHALLFGSTSVAQAWIQVAVWQDGRIVVLRDESGGDFVLRQGGEGQYDEAAGWSAYHAFGCQPATGEVPGALLAGAATRDGDHLDVVTTRFEVRGDRAVAVDRTTRRGDLPDGRQDPLGLTGC